MPERLVQINAVTVEMFVAVSTVPRKLAGAIVRTIKEGKNVSMITIGSGPINQAMKACAIARGMVSPEGFDVWTQTSFRTEVIKGSDKTALQTDVYLVPIPKG
jgi:stage V sporulation protein SpoVS